MLRIDWPYKYFDPPLSSKLCSLAHCVMHCSWQLSMSTFPWTKPRPHCLHFCREVSYTETLLATFDAPFGIPWLCFFGWQAEKSLSRLLHCPFLPGTSSYPWPWCMGANKVATEVARSVSEYGVSKHIYSSITWLKLAYPLSLNRFDWLKVHSTEEQVHKTFKPDERVGLYSTLCYGRL